MELFIILVLIVLFIIFCFGYVQLVRILPKKALKNIKEKSGITPINNRASGCIGLGWFITFMICVYQVHELNVILAFLMIFLITYCLEFIINRKRYSVDNKTNAYITFLELVMAQYGFTFCYVLIALKLFQNAPVFLAILALIFCSIAVAVGDVCNISEIAAIKKAWEYFLWLAAEGRSSQSNSSSSDRDDSSSRSNSSSTTTQNISPPQRNRLEPIKDSHYKVIGYFDYRPSLKIIYITDSRFRRLGEYNETLNKTYSIPGHRIVGDGNQLMRLL